MSRKDHSPKRVLICSDDDSCGQSLEFMIRHSMRHTVMRLEGLTSYDEVLFAAQVWRPHLTISYGSLWDKPSTLHLHKLEAPLIVLTGFPPPYLKPGMPKPARLFAVPYNADELRRAITSELAAST